MRATLALFSLAPALLAQQTPDPFRHVPADAAFVVRTKGLAGWRAELGATGLGKALAAPGTAASWAGLLDSCRKELDPDGAHEKQFGELLELLLGHAGTIVVAGHLDSSHVGPQQPPGFCLSLAVTGDGHTDLAQLAKTIEGLLPGKAVDRQLAGQQVQVHEAPVGQFTAPFLHEGALVMLWSSELETKAALCLDTREHGFPPAPELQRGVLGVQVEAYEPVRALLDAIAKLPEDEAPLVVRGVELAGLRSVQRLLYSAFADGKHVGQEARIEFNDGARGLFDVLMPVRRNNPRLLAYLPPNVQNWAIGIVDVQALQTLYGAVFEQFGDQIPQSREQIEAMFTEFTRLRLHEDFLSLIGGEYMRIDDFAAGVDMDTEHDEQLEELDAQVGDSCFVVHLRDGKVMAQNLDKALRARGLHVGRKMEDYGDTKIHALRLLGTMPIEYAFASDVFVLGIGGGEGTRKNLRSVLDTVAAREQGASATELSAGVQARLQGWPEDWAAIDVGDMTEVLDGMILSLDAVAAMLAEADLEPTEPDINLRLAEFARKLRPELARHDAAVTLLASYSARDAYVMRSRW